MPVSDITSEEGEGVRLPQNSYDIPTKLRSCKRQRSDQERSYEARPNGTATLGSGTHFTIEAGRKQKLPSWKSEESVRQLPTPPSSPDCRESPSSADLADRANDEILLTTHSHFEQCDDPEGLPKSTEDNSDGSIEFPLNPQMPDHRCRAFLVELRERSESPMHRKSPERPTLKSEVSSDRFVSTRSSRNDLPKTFRLKKPAQDLTDSEKLLRHSSASPDPFGPLINRRARRQSTLTINRRASRPAQRNGHQSRVPRNGSPISIEQDVAGHQNRQASNGAVWNIGGNVHSAPSGPVRAVSDGRGGFIGSGSNAPMYRAQFLQNSRSGDDAAALEDRVAAALDINRIGRIMAIPRVPGQVRSASAGAIGLSNREMGSGTESRVHWINGEWVRELGSCR